MRITGLAVAMVFAVAGCTNENQAASAASSVPPAEAQLSTPSSASLIPIKVYKDPGCGCCKEWVKHLEQNGFKVETMDMPDLSAVKAKYGVMPDIQACHTAVVDGYAIEGHVPADVILKMLREKPAIAGLAVPGMPSGSPGMEGAMKERYDVLTFDRAGRTTVYAQR
jgi:hypothetical protein